MSSRLNKTMLSSVCFETEFVGLCSQDQWQVIGLHNACSLIKHTNIKINTGYKKTMKNNIQVLLLKLLKS